VRIKFGDNSILIEDAQANMEEFLHHDIRDDGLVKLNCTVEINSCAAGTLNAFGYNF